MPSSPNDRKSNWRRSATWYRRTLKPSARPPSREKAKAPDSLFGESLARVLRVIAVVVAPTTALAALLFYFGWVYSRAIYEAFGIDQSILGFSNQDYVLRSITVIFQTLRVALVAALFAPWAHFLIRRLVKSQRLEKRLRISSLLAWAFVLLGLGLALSLGSGFLGVGSSVEAMWLTQPIAFTLGFALVGYGLYLSELDAAEPKSGSRQPPENTDMSKGRRWSLVVVVGLVIVGLFWVSANYAHVLGQHAVKDFDAQIKYLPRVTVYSQESLSLQGQGVTLEQVSEDSKAYRYRYTGLRFLARSGSKYFLLPELWTPADGATIILSETGTIRIEAAAGEISR